MCFATRSSTRNLTAGPRAGESTRAGSRGGECVQRDDEMKPLIILLATAVALLSTNPLVEARLDPSSEAAQATAEANVATAGADSATALVVFANDTVRAEVANTSALRSRGLMYREEVPDGTGMLFVWDRDAVRSFWMRNTLVALDVAFIDSNFEIVDIQQMEPETSDVHDGARPAMFALEVRKGWFAENDITVGDRCELIFSE